MAQLKDTKSKHRIHRMYLINARQKMGLSQYKVEQLSGISRAHYNRIENGVVTVSVQFRTLKAISIALDIPFEVMWKEESSYQNSIINDFR